jgi:hypothetical protein
MLPFCVTSPLPLVGRKILSFYKKLSQFVKPISFVTLYLGVLSLASCCFFNRSNFGLKGFHDEPPVNDEGYWGNIMFQIWDSRRDTRRSGIPFWGGWWVSLLTSWSVTGDLVTLPRPTDVPWPKQTRPHQVQWHGFHWTARRLSTSCT